MSWGKAGRSPTYLKTRKNGPARLRQLTVRVLTGRPSNHHPRSDPVSSCLSAASAITVYDRTDIGDWLEPSVDAALCLRTDRFPTSSGSRLHLPGSGVSSSCRLSHPPSDASCQVASVLIAVTMGNAVVSKVVVPLLLSLCLPSPSCRRLVLVA